MQHFISERQSEGSQTVLRSSG